MLTATVQFVDKVGVAPSTMTLQIEGAPGLSDCPPTPDRSWPLTLPPTPPVPPQPKKPWRFYVPYGIPVNGGGLGLINETDAWMTGRPYGLPGTTALRLYEDDAGKWSAGLIGADLGDDLGQDVGELTEIMRQFLAVQKEQQKSVHRIAFWTAMMGGITLGTIIIGVVAGAAAGGRHYKRKTQEA